MNLINRDDIKWYSCESESICYDKNIKCDGCPDQECSYTQVMELPVVLSISVGTTNGDAIRALYPDKEFEIIDEYIEGQIVYSVAADDMQFSLDWWNSEYKLKLQHQVKK